MYSIIYYCSKVDHSKFYIHFSEPWLQPRSASPDGVHRHERAPSEQALSCAHQDTRQQPMSQARHVDRDEGPSTVAASIGQKGHVTSKIAPDVAVAAPRARCAATSTTMSPPRATTAAAPRRMTSLSQSRDVSLIVGTRRPAVASHATRATRATRATSANRVTRVTRAQAHTQQNRPLTATRVAAAALLLARSATKKKMEKRRREPRRN